MASLSPRLKVSRLLDMNPTFLRQNLSGIEELARSMEERGQLFPVIVRGDMTIISGARRLAAAQLLRWKEVDAVVTGDHGKVVDMMIAERKYNDDPDAPEVLKQTPMRAVETAYLIAWILGPLETAERMDNRRRRVPSPRTIDKALSDRRLRMQVSLGLSGDSYKALSAFGHTLLRLSGKAREELENQLNEAEDRGMSPRSAHRHIFGTGMAASRKGEVPEDRLDDTLVAKHQRERLAAIAATLRLLGGELKAAFDYVSPGHDLDWLNQAWSELNDAEKPFRRVRAQMRVAITKKQQTEENT